MALEVPRTALAFAGEVARELHTSSATSKIALKFRAGWRRHADNGDPLPVQVYGAAENGRIAREVASCHSR